jgi:hypothetical protein
VCRSLASFLSRDFPQRACREPRHERNAEAIANCPASIVPPDRRSLQDRRSTTSDRRPHSDRSDRWLLTRPWYFRLSSFQRSRTEPARAPTCAPDQRRVDAIAFICLLRVPRTRNVPPFAVRECDARERINARGRKGEVHRSTAVPLKFYGFRSGRERVQPEDSKDYFRVTKRRWK